MDDMWFLNPSTFTNQYIAYLVLNRMLFHMIFLLWFCGYGLCVVLVKVKILPFCQATPSEIDHTP